MTPAAPVGSQQADSSRPTILPYFLFSGPETRAGGFREAVLAAAQNCGLKAEVKYFDLINGVEQDLADDHIFANIIRDSESGRVHGVLSSPPCSTFSRARKWDSDLARCGEPQAANSTG